MFCTWEKTVPTFLGDSMTTVAFQDRRLAALRAFVASDLGKPPDGSTPTSAEIEQHRLRGLEQAQVMTLDQLLSHSGIQWGPRTQRYVRANWNEVSHVSPSELYVWPGFSELPPEIARGTAEDVAAKLSDPATKNRVLTEFAHTRMAGFLRTMDHPDGPDVLRRAIFSRPQHAFKNHDLHGQGVKEQNFDPAWKDEWASDYPPDSYALDGGNCLAVSAAMLKIDKIPVYYAPDFQPEFEPALKSLQESATKEAARGPVTPGDLGSPAGGPTPSAGLVSNSAS